MRIECDNGFEEYGCTSCYQETNTSGKPGHMIPGPTLWSRILGHPETTPKRASGPAFSVDDPAKRGAGGRQYGTSEKVKQTLEG
jgi:hypothetical protein